MNRSNCTNLKQVEGGRVVKQGDSASLFAFELLDEKWRPIKLEGQQARVELIAAEGKAVFEAVVSQSKVSFNLSNPLPIGSYLVEVHCAGYVFPSDQSVRLEVTQSSEKYETLQELQTTKATLSAEIASYLASHPIDVSGLITAHLAEHPIQAYNDKPLRDDLSALNGKVDKLSNYDDSGLRNEIRGLSERITTIEGKPAGSEVDLSLYALKSELPPVVNLSKYMTSELAHQTFATYSTLQDQLTNNIKTKHLELGLDALIDEKLKNGGDPFVTQSKLPTIDTSQLASKNDLEELKRSVGSASGSGVGTVFGDNFPYDGDNITILKNIPIGSVYVDRLKKNGALKWIKTKMYAEGATRDQAKDCWQVLFGDTGNVKMPMTGSPLNGAVLSFRRVNNIVELTWGGLSWGWFGIKRRGAAGYVDHPSNREKFVTIIRSGDIKSGFIPTGSKLGYMMNDSGVTQGTFYVSGRTDGSHVRLQFLNDVPTDRDIGDLRFTNMTYVTDDPWPENL